MVDFDGDEKWNWSSAVNVDEASGYLSMRDDDSKPDVERFEHLIPDDVEIWEYDPDLADSYYVHP